MFVFSSVLMLKDVPIHAAGTQDGIPVLMYHHLLKKSENHDPRNNSILNLEEFEKQMAFLSNQGYYTATLSELAAYLQGQISLPNKTVVITFDDGYKSNYLYAYPILKKYKFKAGLFLITNRIAEQPVPFNPNSLQFLSRQELKQMEDVFEYGGHTHALHYSNNGVPALLSEPEQVILKDLQSSRNIINTRFFAYPFGGYNKRTMELLNMSGYKYAFTTTQRNAKIGNNPFEIGRKAVTPFITMARFEKMVKSRASNEGWVKSGNNWYYLTGNGTKKTGWLHWGRYWYYLDQNGVMETGWVKSKSVWYYLDKSGVMETGWVKQGTNWHYLDESGAMRTGWAKSEGKWYYLDRSGVMKTGWIRLGKDWYFLDRSGVMKTDWIKSGKNWYYLNSSGVMARSTKIGKYTLGSNGAWIR